jgi:prepilin signal peptidase PulO-like enzyme (type II secretory pathway)
MRYVLIEVGTTILFLLVGYFWSIAGTLSILELVRDLVLVSVVVFVAAYDGLYMEVDPWVTLGGGVVVGILTLFIMPSIWLSLVWGIALGVGWFALQYVVSHGRWVGGGDMFIGFLMGASLGLGRTVVALGVAYIVGASYALGVLSVGQKKRGDEIAFGTFLSLGMVVALFWGNDMLGWYLGLIK